MRVFTVARFYAAIFVFMALTAVTMDASLESIGTQMPLPIIVGLCMAYGVVLCAISSWAFRCNK